MPEGQDERRIRGDIEAVEGHIAATPPRNDQFAQAGFGFAPDERVLFQDAEAIDQYPRRGPRGRYILFHQKRRQTFDVAQRARRKNEAGQGG